MCRKLKPLIKTIVVLALALSTGCSSKKTMEQPVPNIMENLFTSPEPTPSFIGAINPMPGETLLLSKDICLYMDQLALWESGDKEAEFQRHLTSHTYITIDDQTVPTSELTMSFRGIGAPNEMGFVGDFMVCVTPNLEQGIHLVTVEVVTTDGRQLSYSWAFRIK